MTEAGEAGPFRRHYVMSLRDEVPVPAAGWSIFRHPPECAAQAERSGCAGDDCRVADVCRLFVFDGTDDAGMGQGLQDLIAVANRLTGTGSSPPALQSVPRRRVVAVTGSRWRHGEDPSDHYQRCFRLLHDTVNALRLATAARTPNVSIERVWPLYLIVDETADGSYTARNIVVVEHGFRATSPATPEQTAQAQQLILAGWSREPAEMYLEFKLDTMRAADTDGDYVECVLKAAAAAEILLKHTAWMLTWEATAVLTSDPSPTAAMSMDPDVRPASLVGSVLAPRLKGNWASGHGRGPVGGWRASIATRRNDVIHRGYRPSEAEAHAAVAALVELEQHLLDRIAAQGHVYPRTALLLAGRDSLHRRGAWGKVRATDAAENRQTMISRYLSWLDHHLGSST
ncbi:hypothetical protein GCM10011492_30690 [Flexivirga endophytica]|uniref:Uncharacterized protein n=1 Tax=Flexivirga endophytica TaxID=1849103 RepID=A0A916TAB9_9MICO|nr:hypothetical protein [Flexivirga endophytica]GGB37797.1 hypothetical protein GCM10011492_30690 [Flexivirga endophytica]GHB45308.1 hypothetical protein GCM10008112_13080 [Flexivirga endophytica]